MFEESIVGKKVTVWCIDKCHTNPYRLFERMGTTEPDGEQLQALRAEGVMKPVRQFVARENCLSLHLTPNATYLVTVE